MSGSVEVNRKLAPVVISGRVLNEIYAHARESYPAECCGLVTGQDLGCLEKAHRCDNAIDLRRGKDPASYPRGGRYAFRLEPADYVDVLREAEASGASVTGVYHSHVDAGTHFSIEDQESALHGMYPFRDADHIVISVVERVVKEAALFRRPPGAGCFQAGRLVVAGVP